MLGFLLGIPHVRSRITTLLCIGIFPNLSDFINQGIQTVAHGWIGDPINTGHFLKAPAGFDQPNNEFLVFPGQLGEYLSAGQSSRLPLFHMFRMQGAVP